MEEVAHHRRRAGHHAAVRHPRRHDSLPTCHRISVAAINSMASDLNGLAYSPEGNIYNGVVADIRSAYNRFMATAGLELRWPVLFSIDQLEPCPGADGAGLRAAGRALRGTNSASPTRTRRASSSTQPRCSSATSSRATTASKAARAPMSGLRYSGSFANGWTTNALFGQSYHLAGENSFASPDLVNAGAFLGPGDRHLRLCRPGRLRHARTAFRLRPAARLDEQTLEMRRAELKAGYTTALFSVTARIRLHPGPAALRLPGKPAAK